MVNYKWCNEYVFIIVFVYVYNDNNMLGFICFNLGKKNYDVIII